jgi:hypothetical protein
VPWRPIPVIVNRGLWAVGTVRYRPPVVELRVDQHRRTTLTGGETVEARLELLNRS